MNESVSTTLTCSRCGKQFLLTLPRHCTQCSFEEQNQPRHSICYQCGTELNKDKPIYCANCYAYVEKDFERRINDYQKRTDELQSKLLIIGAQKSKLEALFHQNEELLRVLLLERGEHAS